MKKLSLYIIIGVSLLMVSCNLVISDNGDLDGLWQLRTIENLRTGQISDGRDRGVQWAFQGSLLQLCASTDTIFSDVFCSFCHDGATLELTNPHFFGRFVEGVNDDVRVEDAKYLHVYGLYRLEESYRVLQLDGETMRLQSDSVRLYFRKY